MDNELASYDANSLLLPKLIPYDDMLHQSIFVWHAALKYFCWGRYATSVYCCWGSCKKQNTHPDVTLLELRPTLEAFCCYTCYNSLRFYDNSMQEACISSELVMEKHFSCIKPWRKSCLYFREFDACSYGMCAHNLFITVRGNEVTGDVFAECFCGECLRISVGCHSINLLLYI